MDGGDGHADRAWAAFLGIYAAATGHERFGYLPVRLRRDPEGDPVQRPVQTTAGFKGGLW